MDLDQLAQEAGFHKAEVPNPLHPVFILNERPYYFSERRDGGHDIVDFEGTGEISSARYFRLDQQQGPIFDLNTIEPTAKGEEVITILRAYPLIRP